MRFLLSVVRNSVKEIRPIYAKRNQMSSSLSTNIIRNLSTELVRFVAHQQATGETPCTSFSKSNAVKSSVKVQDETECKKRFISRYMQIKLEVYGLDLLPDRNTRRLIGRNEAGLLAEPRCLAQQWYWRVVLKVSKNEYNIILKERLNAAGISTLDFSYAMAKVYGHLNGRCLFCKFIPFDKADIVEILKELDLNDVQFESIRIMLNMEIMPEFHF